MPPPAFGYTGVGIPAMAPQIPSYGLQQPSQQPNPKEVLTNLARIIDEKKAYDALQLRRKQIPTDVLLDYSIFDKVAHRLKTTFVTLPKSVWKGLIGSKDFTFADAMLVAKVPYYLGGLGLTLSPFIGGNKGEGIRQGAAVLLYLLGAMGTNGVINGLYKWRYGIDLTMMYRSKNGPTEYVFASSNFPRFDLLQNKHYRALAEKMGIPFHIQDPQDAVRDQLRYAIVTSRTLKLIVGNIISAIGAGYLAKSDRWADVPKAFPVIRQIWQNRGLGVWGKLSNSAATLGEAFRAVLIERLNVASAPLWRKVVVYGGLASILGTIGFILTRGVPHKRYVTTTEKPKIPYLNLQQNPQLEALLQQLTQTRAQGGQV